MLLQGEALEVDWEKDGWIRIQVDEMKDDGWCQRQRSNREGEKGARETKLRQQKREEGQMEFLGRMPRTNSVPD